MRISVVLENPLKCFKFGWSYKSKVYDTMNLDQAEVAKTKIWVFEINLGFIVLMAGDVDIKLTPPKPTLKSIPGGANYEK